MDSKCNTRLPLRTSRIPSPRSSQDHSYPPQDRKRRFITRGNLKPTGKRGSDTRSPKSTSFCLHPLSSREKIRGSTSRNKPQFPERLHGKNIVQNGGDSNGRHYNPTRGLSRFRGSEGRLLPHPNSPGAPTLPHIHIPGPSVSIHLPPIRPNLRSQGIYQDHKTSPSPPQTAGPTLHNIHRRHPPMCEFKTASNRTQRHNDPYIYTSGFHHQQGKICTRTGQDHHLSRSCTRLNRHDYVSTSGENRKDPSSDNFSSLGPTTISPPDSQCDRLSGLYLPSHCPGPYALQGPGSTQELDPRSGQGFLQQNPTVATGQSRPTVVDTQYGNKQWETNKPPANRLHHNIRCIEGGVGGGESGQTGFGALDPTGGHISHQRSGAVSGLPWPESFHQTLQTLPHSPPNGQQLCGQLYQPHGGLPLPISQQTSHRHLDMGPTKEHLALGISHCRNIQHQRRPIEQTILGQDRMATLTKSVHGNNTNIPEPPNRPIRIQNKPPNTKICVVETRPPSMEDRCLLPILEAHSSLRFSPILPPEQNATENRARPSSGHTDIPTVANTSLVPTRPPTVHRLSNHPPQGNKETPTPSSSAGNTPSITSNGPNSMATFRNTLTRKGFSEKATNILFASWRKGTAKQYQAAWSAWLGWCRRRHSDPLSGTIKDIIHFLTDQYHQGKGYSTLNSYMSALSSILDPISGCPVGQHPTIIRFLRGVFNLRPPQPKYATTWDVDKVLNLLSSWVPVRELSLKELTLKLVMLVALVSADRGQSMALMKVSTCSFTHSQVTFVITDPTKTSRPGRNIKKITLPAFPQNKALCTKLVLRQYLKRTKPLRSLGNRDRLFLSYRRPYKPILSCTIARWIRTVLARAGILGYGAHSTRSASTSAAAAAGLSTQAIMRTADWSKESTFTKFYKRHSDTSSLGKTILTLAQRQ